VQVETAGRTTRRAVSLAAPSLAAPPATAVADQQRPGGFARRYLTLFTGEVVSKACVFAAFAYLARVLGPQGFGLIELALSITLFFVMAVDGGLGSYGARIVNTNPEEAPRLLARITGIRMAAAGIAYVPVLLVSLFYGLPGAGMLAVYGLIVFFVPFFNQWMFQGIRAMHWVAAGTVLRNVTFAAVVFLTVRPGADLRLVAMAEVAGVAALAIFTTFLLYAVVRIRPDTQDLFSGASQILRQSWPLGASEVTWAALWYSPGIVLGAFSTTDQVAWLAGPLRIVLALHTFVWLYFFNLLPGLSRALATRVEDWSGLTARSLQSSMWPACFVALTGTFLAPFIVRSVYGAAYGAASLPLQIVVWMIPIAWFSGHFRYSLIAAGGQRWEFSALAATAVVTISLACILAPPFGAVGAAAALVAGGATNAVLAWYAVLKRVGPLSARGAADAILSAMLCGAIGFALANLINAPAGAAIALMIYTVIAAHRNVGLTRLAFVWLQR